MSENGRWIELAQHRVQWQAEETRNWLEIIQKAIKGNKGLGYVTKRYISGGEETVLNVSGAIYLNQDCIMSLNGK
jgi:hypothetical protein